MKNITESRFFYRLVMSFSIMIVRNTLVTTYGIDKNEYSSVFTNIITLDDLFRF